MRLVYPEFLLLMFLPLIVLAVLVVTNKSHLEQIFDEAILRRLSVFDGALSARARNTLFFLALFFMIIALSRPVIEKDRVTFGQEGFDLVIAVDLSRSMQSDDLYPTRLAFAQKKIEAFLKLQGERVGMVAFSRDAFLISPLTYDTEAVGSLLAHLDTDAILSQGARFESAIEAAAMLLKKSDKRAILFVTDGGDQTDFSREIRLLARYGIRAYILGVGGENKVPIRLSSGSFLKDVRGNIVMTSLNKRAAKMAFESGGIFVQSSLGDEDIKRLVQKICDDAQKESAKELNSKSNVSDSIELFYYPLVVAVLILLFAFYSWPKKVAKNVAFLLFFFFSYERVYAALFDFQTIREAKQAYDQKNYSKSSALYKNLAISTHLPQAYYNLGNSLYREGKFKEAIRAYGRVATEDRTFEAKKLYNIANCYMQMGQFDKAKEFYEKSLKIQDDEDARYNLKIANMYVTKEINSYKNDQMLSYSHPKEGAAWFQADQKKYDIPGGQWIEAVDRAQKSKLRWRMFSIKDDSY